MYKNSRNLLIYKRFFDISIIVFFHIMFFPIVILFWIFIPLLIWIVDYGPVFYYQMRVGKHGKLFKVFKFRTMRVQNDEDSVNASVFTLPDDVRVTSIGKILRTFRLDEVPQLFNILRGEMSFVGPRPQPKETLDYYRSKGWSDLIDVRLEVLPGIAGLAQSKGVFKKGESLTEGPNKFRYDALYVRNKNLCFDIVLLFKCTILVIARRL